MRSTDPDMLDSLNDRLSVVKKADVRQFPSAELRLNRDRVHWAPQHTTKQILPSAGPPTDLIKPVARNLGVWSDENLSFELHTAKLVQSCFYHLRNISKTRPIF